MRKRVYEACKKQIICLMTVTVFICSFSQVFATSLVPATESPEQQSEKLYYNGLKNLENGEYGEAQSKFQASLRFNPNNVNALLGLADIAYKKKDFAAVKENIDRALLIDPDNAAVQTGLGRYLYLTGEFFAAKSAFTKAISLNPNMIDPYIELGSLYLLHLNSPEMAVNNYKSALILAPERLDLYYPLSTALLEMGNLQEAVSTLFEVARKEPDDPYPLQLLGTTYTKLNKYDKAIESFNKALKINPDLYQANWAIGEIHRINGQEDSALEQYEKVLAHEPNYIPALMNSGIIYQTQKRYNLAEQAYKKVLMIDPKAAIAYNNLAFLRTETGSGLDDALEWAKKAVALAPEAILFQDTLGWVYYARKDFVQAASILENVAASSPETGVVYYHLGIVYSDMNRKDEAQQALKKAESLLTDPAEKNDAQTRLNELVKNGP